MPRLPTVNATEPPGRTLFAIRLPRIACRTAPGTSASSGWRNDWRTRAIGGKVIGERSPWIDWSWAIESPTYCKLRPRAKSRLRSQSRHVPLAPCVDDQLGDFLADLGEVVVGLGLIELHQALAGLVQADGRRSGIG